MSFSPRATILVCLAVILAFVAGVTVGVTYFYYPTLKWTPDLTWTPIAALAAAVLNCLTVGVVAWAITTRLQDKQAGKRFERALLADFIKSALSSASRIHDQLLDCRHRNNFSEGDRQSFISLFTALGQDLQLIQDALGMMGLCPLADVAQHCRSEYKDLLTDRAVDEIFTQGDEHNALVKHRQMRKYLVELIIQANRL